MRRPPRSCTRPPTPAVRRRRARRADAAPPAAAAGADDAAALDAALATLASLGFGDDDARNAALLRRFEGSVDRVVNHLLDA